MMAYPYDSMANSSSPASEYRNGTETANIPEIRLYTVLTCLIIMLSFGIMGTLSSMALLLSTRCKSSVRSMEFGLPYGLATADLLLCLAWVPLELFRLGLNHIKVAFPPFLCYLNVLLFYFCLSVIVFIIIFIAFHRLLTYLSIQTVARTYAIIGLVTSTGLATVLTALALLKYGHTVDYSICAQIALNDGEATHIYLPIVLVNGIYVLVIGAVCACLVGIVVKQKQKLNPKPSPVVKTIRKKSKPKKISENAKVKELSDRELSDKSQENESSHCSVRFMEPSCSKEKSSNSSKTASKESFFSRPFLGFTRDCKKADKSADDSDLDDDEFDQKMKKLQKSASGRRHTVANIGLGESLYGHKKETFGSRSPSPNPTNYQYVRKWSVDIVALQDQLENPKKIYETSSFSEFKRFREKRDLDENKIEEEKHDEKDFDKEIIKKKDLEHKTNPLKDGNSPSQNNCEDINKDTQTNNSNQLADNYQSSTIKKTILSDKSISHTKSFPSEGQLAEVGEKQEEEKTDKNIETSANDARLMNNSVTVVSAMKNSGSRDRDRFECRISENVDVIEDEAESEVNDDEEEDEDEEEILEVPVENKKELIRELQLHTTCLLLVLVALVCTLPFCLLQLVQEFMQPMLNRNASYVTAAVVLVQLPIHTVIVAWLERKLWLALRHLRVAFTHLTCVCYCNIGKGRQCFGRPHYNGKSSTV